MNRLLNFIRGIFAWNWIFDIFNKCFPRYKLKTMSSNDIFEFEKDDGKFYQKDTTVAARYVVRKDQKAFTLSQWGAFNTETERIYAIRHRATNEVITLSKSIFEFFFVKYSKSDDYRLRFNLGRFILDGQQMRRVYDGNNKIINVVYYKVIHEDSNRAFIFNESTFNLLLQRSINAFQVKT